MGSPGCSVSFQTPSLAKTVKNVLMRVKNETSILRLMIIWGKRGVTISISGEPLSW